MRKIQFTKQGHLDMLKEKEVLEKDRVEAVKQLQWARELGDLSENAAYKVARSKLSGIDARLRRINGILRKVNVVEPPSDGYADIGSTITCTDGVSERTIILVDGNESDFAKGRISVYSPIGKAIRGKMKNDKVLVHTPAGTIEYRITELV